MFHNTCLNSFTCTSYYRSSINNSYSCCCCCCCCCSNNNNNNINYNYSTNLIYINSLPRINPSFLCNGLRQSTLIQFSPSKRLGYYGKRVSLISDSDRKYYYHKLDSFKEKNKFGKVKSKYSCSGYEINDEVESLLDLLSEGVGVENVSVRARKRIEKKESGKKKNVCSGSVKRGNKGVEIRSREEEDRKKVVNKVNIERKKGGSSCSSYYSVASMGEYDSENDVEIKRDDGFGKGESSSEYKNDWKSDGYRSYDERVEENVDRRHEIGKKESETVKKSTAEMYYGNEEWRKKSEKKLNVESSQHSERNNQERSERNDRIIDQTQSRMKYKTLLGKSEMDDKVIESSSSSKKRYSGTDNKLITSEYKGESSNRITREDEYRRRSNAILEASRIHETNKETRMKNWEDNSIKVSGQVEGRREEKHQRIDKLTALKESRVRSEHISDTNITSSSLETRMKNWEDNSVKVSGQVDDRREEQHQRIDKLTALKESRVKSEQVSDTNITSSSLETRMKKWEDNSVKVSGQVDDRREEQHQRIDKLTALNDSRMKSEEISDISDTRMPSSSYETRMNSWEDNITEVRGQIDDRREEKHQRLDQSTTLNDSRLNLQRFTEISDTRITDTENTSVSRRQSDMIREKQDTVTIDQRANLRRKNVEETYSSSSGVEKVEGVTEAMKTGRRTTKASSFNVGLPREASSSYKALKLNPEPNLQKPGARGSGRTGSLPIATTSSAGEIHEQPQDNARVQPSEISGGDVISDSHQEPLSYISHEDAIVSAGQQQKPSSQFVGEFVKKAKHELSISEVQHEKKTHEEKSSGEDSSGNSDQKDGPSDDMWHEAGESSRQPLGTTEAIELTGNDELVKSGGRSLWTVIGDVVRLRWSSPRSEGHTPKSSGGKMLSTQSTGSERWFSGHEPEDSNDEILKTGSTKSTKSRSRKEKGQREGLDSPLSSSLNTNQGSSSKTMSPSVIEESSFPVPAIRMRRSPAVKRTSGETDASTSGRIDQLVPKPLTQVPQTEASSSGKMVIVDQPVSTSVTEMGLKDSKDGEIKQRKLARIDQVTRDRFDEWEEAYTVEADQLKNDEFFMREALLEAKKAADFWEVPVGAVLVQDGKVIARGYNLVEELRDSTAHAEMICIREASNNLRSWRLSGTTLYVTLEPCPMCAGAILQARVDTVVWGAPNKLLGADGSWIRLFPDGDGGSGSDKPPAPVHPFHPNMVVRRGVLSTECADVMQQFFQLRRKKKEKRTEDEPPTPPPSCLPITHHHNSKFFSKMHGAFSLMFCL